MEAAAPGEHAEPTRQVGRRESSGLLVPVAVLLFGSGLCALVYQVSWLRLLRLVFGASTASTAAVLAIFMGGLGLGGAVLGRRASRSSNPLRLYAHLELGIAGLALASPLLVLVARAAYLGIGGEQALGGTGATVVRLALSVLVLGVTTTLMGGTLPAVSQAVGRAADPGRRGVAWLYGSNALGGVLGALLTAFLLIELLGVRNAIWIAALLNLLVALVARSLSRSLQDSRPEPTVAPETREPESPPGEGDDGSAAARRRARLVLGAGFVAGFVFLSMELVWYRMLAPILGGSSYTFALILAWALLGIGLGGLLYALGPTALRPGLGALSITFSLEACLVLLPLALGDDVALLAYSLRVLQGLGFWGLVAGWAAVVSLVVLPAAMVSGYQFPLLVGLMGSGERRVGYDVGRVYAWNTWGAIAGSLLTGFGLLPLLTAPTLWRGCGLLLTALGVAALVLSRRGPFGQGRLRAAAPGRRAARYGGLAPHLTAGAGVTFSVLALLLLLPAGPTAFWRHGAIGAGRALGSLNVPNGLRAERNDLNRALVFEAEGHESSVALIRRDDLALLVNGKSDGSGRGDAPTVVMSALIGAALHPDPRDVLVIGLGTGMTAGWFAEIESVRQVDVVELEPAVAQIARSFAPLSFGAMNRATLSLHFGDGREWVQTSKKRYDLIFSEPSNPYRAGVASLFSLDFYRAASRRLAPRGIFLQWLQGYEVDADVVETALATLAAALPHVEIWQTHDKDLLLVAAAEPIDHDVGRLRRRLEREPFPSGLRWTWGVEGVEGLYTGFLAGPELAASIAASDAARVSTDDRPVIEYGFARNVGTTGRFEPKNIGEAALRIGAHRPPVHNGAFDWEAIRELRELRAVANALGRPEDEELPRAAAARRAARYSYDDGDLTAAARYWFAQEQPARFFLDRLMLAELAADLDAPDAEERIGAIAELAPTEALALRARLALARGEPQAATEAFSSLGRSLQENAWYFTPLVLRSLNQLLGTAASDPRSATVLLETYSTPFANQLHEDRRRRLVFGISVLPGVVVDCRDLFLGYEPNVPWRADFLAARLACYEQAGDPRVRRARRELETFLRDAPRGLSAGRPTTP